MLRQGLEMVDGDSMIDEVLMMKMIFRRSSFFGVGLLFSFILFPLIWGSASLLALSVSQVPNPRRHMAWVSDTIDILPASMEAEINAKLSALEQETGIEIALVTVESVDAATPKDFATELFNVWGIGKRESNNGLLILLVRGERRLEMETGYGLEWVLPDGWLKRMQGEEMVPHFKNERYDLGLEAGVDAVLVRLRQSPQDVSDYQAGGNPRVRGSQDYDGGEGEPWWLYFLGVGAGGAGLGLAGTRYRYKRARTCTACKKPMEMVPDGEDEIYLNSGEITEQHVKAVDYQFYHCTDCGLKRRLVVSRWFSGYSKCKRCGYKTLRTTTITLRAATTFSTGLKEITEDCKHCDYHHKRRVMIPRVTQSSGGGSGGGGSFGGGSSGGGGAGSSW